MRTTTKLLGKLTVLLPPLACLVSSCSLLGEPTCPNPPYFPFSAADKKWQGFTAGTQWIFENQRHQRRTYQVRQVDYEEKTPVSIAYPSIRVIYYRDYWVMSWERVDSLAQVGYCLLRRVPVEKDYTQSTLTGEVQWRDYIGQDNNTGGIYSGYLYFGPDLSTISFHELVVKGVKYQRVTSFKASDLAISRLSKFNSSLKTTQLDYDQAMGVVRFATLNGDIWERLP